MGWVSCGKLGISQGFYKAGDADERQAVKICPSIPNNQNGQTNGMTTQAVTQQIKFSGIPTRRKSLKR